MDDMEDLAGPGSRRSTERWVGTWGPKGKDLRESWRPAREDDGFPSELHNQAFLSFYMLLVAVSLVLLEAWSPSFSGK